MRTNDETMTLPLNVDEAALEKIAKQLGVKISTSNGIIVIEGDEAEIDEAIRLISELPELPDEDEDYFEDKWVDPYASLEAGQRYSDKDGHLPDEYSVYDLIDFDESKGLWRCKRTTYHFKRWPYDIDYVSTDYGKISPESLIKMKKVSKRK